MKVKKRSLEEIQFISAPNRTIGEVYSGQTFGALGVTFRIVEMVPAAEQTPRRPHMHEDFEEVIHCLAGRGRVWSEGEWMDLNPGDTILVPPGVMHATFNASDVPVRLLCFFPRPEGVDARVRADFTLTLNSIEE